VVVQPSWVNDLGRWLTRFPKRDGNYADSMRDKKAAPEGPATDR
jgi:hypothetical protein